jgi:hypothetical protein
MLCGRFFKRLLEPAMYKMLVVALFTACVVNVACLCGHLGAAAPPMAGYVTTLPMRVAASSLGSQ